MRNFIITIALLTIISLCLLLYYHYTRAEGNYRAILSQRLDSTDRIIQLKDGNINCFARSFGSSESYILERIVGTYQVHDNKTATLHYSNAEYGSVSVEVSAKGLSISEHDLIRLDLATERFDRVYFWEWW